MRPAPIGDIDIQIHLEDQRCIGNLRRVLRQTLRRSAATWAPVSLPLNRIVVGAGFPADGKADIYDRFTYRESDQSEGRLVVMIGGDGDWNAGVGLRRHGKRAMRFGSRIANGGCGGNGC